MTFNFRIAFTPIICCIFISCVHNKTEDGKSKQPVNKKEFSTDELNTSAIKSIVIDTFSKFPPEIDGCGCYFSTDEQTFKKQTYIYADDYEQTAFILINHKMTKFSLQSSKKFLKTLYQYLFE